MSHWLRDSLSKFPIWRVCFWISYYQCCSRLERLFFNVTVRHKAGVIKQWWMVFCPSSSYLHIPIPSCVTAHVKSLGLGSDVVLSRACPGLSDQGSEPTAQWYISSLQTSTATRLPSPQTKSPPFPLTLYHSRSELRKRSGDLVLVQRETAGLRSIKPNGSLIVISLIQISPRA